MHACRKHTSDPLRSQAYQDGILKPERALKFHGELPRPGVPFLRDPFTAPEMMRAVVRQFPEVEQRHATS